MADSQALCLTPACLQMASRLASQISPHWDKMDPCTEFDKMVCHGFADMNGEDLNVLHSAGARNSRIIKSIIEGSYSDAIDYQATRWNSTWTTNAVDEANFKMLQRSYETCMDTESISKAGSQPLVNLIATLNTIWPHTEDLKAKLSPSDYDGLSKATFFLEEMGISPFVKLGVQSDYFAPMDRVASVAQTELINYQNTSMYDDPEALKSFVKDIVAVMATPNYPGTFSAEEATAIAEGIVNLEVDLKKTMPPPVMGSANAGNITLKELGALLPALGIDKVLRNLLPADFPDDKRLVLEPVQFFANLSKIITSYPKAVLQSYMISKAIVTLTVADQAVLTNGSPTTSRSDRAEFCFKHIDDALRFVVGRFFVSATYTDKARELQEKVATELRGQFKERIDTLEWMSPEAKERAKKKVDNIQQNIGYPTANPDIRSPESVAAFYKNLNVTDSFFNNVISVRKSTVSRSFGDVLKPVNRKDLGDKIQEPNAYYNPYVNSINILPGISQLPLFSEALPSYATYGTLGAFVGHEILHGFDNTGREFNENAEHVSWWDNKTISAFEERTQCFVKQYDAFTYPIPGGKTMNTNGSITLGENLSDAGGLRIAWDAWKKVQAKNKDLNIPGLERFTHEELFFIFYGNAWCSSHTPEYNLKTYPTEAHAPTNHRLIGAAANSRAFREVFKCKVKEPQCELF